MLKTNQTVNDFHSKLNKSNISGILQPKVKSEVIEIFQKAVKNGQALSICGKKGSMGGQQFCKDRLLLDLSLYTGIESLDQETGLAWVLPGTTWKKLYSELQEMQIDNQNKWSFRQKQTGCDELSIGGAISVNAHGRGLKMKPIVSDVEAIEVLLPNGEKVFASRTQNKDTFAKIVGGYGLFGLVLSIQLRLVKKSILQRKVITTNVDQLNELLDSRIKNGFTYGDFQFCCDPDSPEFFQQGIFSCYKPTELQSIPGNKAKLTDTDWKKLYYMARKNKGEVYRLYRDYYLQTDGQYYDSDEQQMSHYQKDYAEYIAHQHPEETFKTEMITEFYVPRKVLPKYLKSLAKLCKKRQIKVFYATVRWIQKEDVSELPWATSEWACLVLNVTVAHENTGIAKAKSDFKALMDCTLEFDGKWFLTYQNWATKEQIAQAYPEFEDWLKAKKHDDPNETLVSNWYLKMKRKFELL